MFELSRESAVPLVDQIAERITKLVQHGQLAAGARMPSIRKLAKLVGASPFTVVDAYDRLVARGLIESRAGRGFFVTRRRPAAPLAAIEALPDTGSDALATAHQRPHRGDRRPSDTVTPRHGLTDQEAPQAHAQEETQEAAEEDSLATSSAG